MNTIQPQPQPVPITRVIENAVFRDGAVYKRTLNWTADTESAPARWLTNRTELQQSFDGQPGRYCESGRIIDAATGDILASYEHEFTIDRPKPEPVEQPKLRRRHRVALALVAAPGVLAAIAATPFALACYLSFGAAIQLEKFFHFWLSLEAPEPSRD